MDKNYHIPVLLAESINSLNIQPNGTYIDGTLGEGGHSFEIYKKLSKKGKLISIDQDINAIDFVKKKYSKQLLIGNWVLEHGNFSNIQEYSKQADGIFLDIGMSSRQLGEVEGRGFSYQNDTDPLDMRMDQRTAVKASDLLKALSAKELVKLFVSYGEEPFAKRIAKTIKQNGNIETVGDLTRLIYRVVPATSKEGGSKHPARRVFQALRIAVNDELNVLKETLDKSFEILNTSGRISVIAFHSLEDRIVKQYFEQKVVSNQATYPSSKFIQPSEEQKKENPRCRSATLRTIEKN